MKVFRLLIKMRTHSGCKTVSYLAYKTIHTIYTGLRAWRKLLLGLRTNRALRRRKVGRIECVSFRT